MDEPTVEVTAVGRASQVPDQVAISLGVEVSSPTVGQSLREASAAVERLVALLDEIDRDGAGVAEADRQTTGLSVQPDWRGEKRPEGHIASYRLRLRVADLDGAGRLVQQAEEQVGDALRVHAFELAVADPRPVQEQARTAAVVACRRQAEQLARAAGVELGPLQLLSEGGGTGVARGFNLGYRASARASADLPIEAGELETVVAVTAVWQLRSAD